MTNEILVTDYHTLLKHWDITEQEYAFLHVIPDQIETMKDASDLKHAQRPFDPLRLENIDEALLKFKHRGYIKTRKHKRRNLVGLTCKGCDVLWTFWVLQQYKEVSIEKEPE